MASEFAEKLLEKIDQGDGTLTALETPEYEDLIDAELQEVREVVKIVAHPKFDAGGDGIHYYLTKADIERARALMLKLEVRS